MTVPVALCVSSVDFDGSVLLNPRVHGRIQVALADVADLLKARFSSEQAAARHHGRCRSDPGRCRSDRVGAKIVSPAPGGEGPRPRAPSRAELSVPGEML